MMFQGVGAHCYRFLLEWMESGDLHESQHVLHDVVHESRVLALDLVPAVHLAQPLPVLQSGKWYSIVHRSVSV